MNFALFSPVPIAPFVGRWFAYLRLEDLDLTLVVCFMVVVESSVLDDGVMVLVICLRCSWLLPTPSEWTAEYPSGFLCQRSSFWVGDSLPSAIHSRFFAVHLLGSVIPLRQSFISTFVIGCSRLPMGMSDLRL